MQKTKLHNTRFKLKSTFCLRMVAILLIFIGLFVCSTNLYHYSRGYLAGRPYTSPVSAKEEDTQKLNEDVNSVEENTAVTENNIASESTVDLDMRKNLNEPLVYTSRPKSGEQFGALSIPKLSSTLPIYEGTDESELDLGVGHYEGSVLPGEKDNCVLAGHRDTVFRRLGEVGEGDTLIVTTDMGEFEYVVNKVRIVDKEDHTVIVPKPKATLTISTCYPFHYIGSAPQRYVLTAYLSSATLNQERSEGK